MRHQLGRHVRICTAVHSTGVTSVAIQEETVLHDKAFAAKNAFCK